MGGGAEGFEEGDLCAGFVADLADADDPGVFCDFGGPVLEVGFAVVGFDEDDFDAVLAEAEPDEDAAGKFEIADEDFVAGFPGDGIGEEVEGVGGVGRQRRAWWRWLVRPGPGLRNGGGGLGCLSLFPASIRRGRLLRRGAGGLRRRCPNRLGFGPWGS